MLPSTFGQRSVTEKPVLKQHPAKKLYWELFIAPLWSQEKKRLGWILLALLLLGLAQGGFLLFLGPFMKALLGLRQFEEVVTASQLFGRSSALAFLPFLEQISFSRQQLILGVSCGLLLAGLLRNLAVYLYQLHSSALSLFVAKTFRQRLFAKILHSPYSQISQRTAAEWMSFLMNDVLFLQTRFSDIMNSFIRDSMVMGAGILTLLVLSWPTALLILLLAPWIALGMGRTGKKIAFFAESWQKELSLLVDFILELRKRFYFVRAQKGEARELQRFASINTAYYRFIRKSLMVRASFAPMMEFLGFGVFAVIAFLVGQRHLGGQLEASQLLVFFGALGLLLRPLRNIGEQLAKFHETKGALQRSLELFRAAPLPAPGPLLAPAAALEAAAWTITRVKSAFTAASAPMQAAALELRPAKAIAVIGPSGAGKSTLIKTLAGLLAPQEWLASCPWEHFTSLVSMVSQEPFFFEDSILANLLYGLDGGQVPSQAALQQALETVAVHGDVAAFPGQLAYPIRALGSNLSGGQLQRLVIARALLRQKPILILDEATSALDAATEKNITLSLIAACRHNQSVLLAATHRLRWLESFDEVWFVEGGRVSLMGPHRELLHHPRYCEFYRASE